MPFRRAFVNALVALGLAASTLVSEELTGRVSSLHDDPLPQVAVSATQDDGSVAKRVGLTDASGRFRLILPPGHYQLAFELAAFEPRRGAVLIVPGRAARSDMVLVESPRGDRRVCLCEPLLATDPPGPTPGPIEWRVRVVDTGNQLLPHAIVEVCSLGLILTTESDGAACFWGPGNFIPTLRVTAWPFRPVDADLCCLGNNGAVMVGTEIER
jgi:hypothetical protein